MSASGKIQPKRLVNISAETPGRVVDLAVNEGDRITKGQFLLQIDPKSLRSRVEGNAASLESAEGSLSQMRQMVETARVTVEQNQQNLTRQRNLWAQQLTTREALEKAENDLRTAQSALQEREKSVTSQSSRISQERATLESARYDLTKVRMESPIDGIVTRRNIQQGETAMIGTMNNAGTVLLQLADMSVIQAEVEVDETNIPHVQLDQIAKITIDAIPDRSFKGHVSEIGNSPIQAAAGSTVTQATNFKVVVILDEPVRKCARASPPPPTSPPPPARTSSRCRFPRSRCASWSTTPTARSKEPRTDKRRKTPVETVAAAAELKPGQTRKEVEGVFLVRDNRAEFLPIKMGIAGDKYFEVLGGLKSGDQVIPGPYNSVRTMADGDTVKVDNGKKGK